MQPKPEYYTCTKRLTLRGRRCTMLLYLMKHAGTYIGVFTIPVMAINSRKVDRA